MSQLIFNNFYDKKFPIHQNIANLIFIFLPLTLITGPFLPDLFLSLLGLYFLVISIKCRYFHLYRNKFIIVLFLFYFLILLRGMFSYDPYNLLINYDGPLFYFRYIFFILAVKYLISSNIKILKLFTIILSCTILFTVFDGFIQYFTGSNLFGFPPTGNRITGIFHDEEILGHFLAHIVPPAFALLIYYTDKNNLKKIALLMLFLVISEIMIFLSNDRSGFLKIFQFTLLLIFLSNNFKIFRLISFLLSILIISILISKSDHSNNRFKDTITEVSSTTIPYMPWSTLHEKHYSVAYDLFKKNPIFGTGPQNFKFYCITNPNINGCTSQPHNYYMQTLAELGLLGIIFLFIGFFYFLKVLFQQFLNVWFLKKYESIPDNLIILYSQSFLIFWPLIPTQSFYNNWLNVSIFITLALVYYFKDTKKNA